MISQRFAKLVNHQSITVIVLALLLISHNCQAKVEVNVGGYYYPPFIDITPDNIRGITVTLLEILNRQQTQYHFNFVLTTAKRRYQDFSNNKFDVIFFENETWGWQQFPIEISNTYITGEEIYIALQKPKRGQSYFNTLTDKTIAGIKGYHYRLFNYKIEESELTTDYKIVLSKNHQRNIDLLLSENIDIAIVNRSYLQHYQMKFPAIKNKLLISNKLDQRYAHKTLLRKNGTIPVKSFNQLLQQLEENGALKRLWQQYGLDSKWP